MSHAISFQMAGLDQLLLISASLIKFGIYTPPPRSVAVQITDKQSTFVSRFSSGLLLETMWHCDMDCKMRFITCQWSLAVCSLGLLMRGGADRAAPWQVAQPEGGPLWTTTLGLDRKPGTVGWMDSAFLYEAAWLLEVRICP